MHQAAPGSAKAEYLDLEAAPLEVVDLIKDESLRQLGKVIHEHCHAPRNVRTELIAIVGIYNARVVDVGASTMILEITAFPSKVEQFIEIMRPFGIKELLRTGRIAMTRGVPASPLGGRPRLLALAPSP